MDDSQNENVPLNSTATASSFTTSTGGTLILEYVGDSNSISQTCYTKIVYFTAEALSFYLAAENSETILDFLYDQVTNHAISHVTTAIALEIALHLNVTYAAVVFLVGLTIDFVIWLINSIPNWDLENALNNSTTGKVKLVCYYNRTIAYPYYQSFENFEPWNSNTVDIPPNYDHYWYENVYDYESNACNHTFGSYISRSNGIHSRQCSLCDCIIVYTCRYTATQYNSLRHKITCSDCNYNFYEAHSWNIGKNKCLVCGYNTEGSVLQKTKTAEMTEPSLLL